jgi:hypothetical protein
MSGCPKVTSSILYTQGSQKVNEEVEKELNVPDPEPGTAQASIEEFFKQEDKTLVGNTKIWPMVG